MPRSLGVPVSLVRIATADGVWLDGVVSEPRGRRRAAVVWVHGLGSVFSSGQPLTRELSTRLNAAGIAGPVDSADSIARKMGPLKDAANLFYILNNLYPGDPVTPGAAYKIIVIN